MCYNTMGFSPNEDLPESWFGVNENGEGSAKGLI